MRPAVVMVAVAAFALAACGNDDDVSASAAAEVDAAEVDAAEVEAEPEPDPEPGPVDEPEPAEDEVAEASLSAPATITPPIGVDYTATGSINESWTLIVGEFEGEAMSIFSNADSTMYVQDEDLTVCSTGERCIRVRREAFEQMGLLGGQLVEDAMAFVADVPFTSASSDTIAGRDARCLVVDDDDLEEYCHDLESGIALRWKVVDEGIDTLVEATRVFVPTEDDLRLPDQVDDMTDVDMGGLDMGGFDLGDVDPETFDPADLDIDY